MADVTVGGQVYSVSLPNFKKLKAAWRFIGAVQASSDPMDSVDAILGIVSVGASTPVSVEELEDALTPREMIGLRPFVNQLMLEVGLAADPEAQGPLEPPAEEAEPSTGATEA